MSIHMMTTKCEKGYIYCNTGISKSSDNTAKREGFFFSFFLIWEMGERKKRKLDKDGLCPGSR